MNTVPKTSQIFIDSPKKITAKIAAKKGEHATKEEDLAAPILLIARYCKDLPPVKVINPTIANHKYEIGGRVIISSKCIISATLKLNKAETTNDIIVAPEYGIFCKDNLMKTALPANPKAAHIDNNIPVIKETQNQKSYLKLIQIFSNRHSLPK